MRSLLPTNSVSQTADKGTPSDQAYMRTALVLARRCLGRVWPNPAVGCILVHFDLEKWRCGKVVGRGWTQPGGRPHAETQALDRAGEEARGATAYVSLEPCNYHSKTPPCTQALIDSGISRVVTALKDPNPKVSGQGLGTLKDAGIEVNCGICAEEAAYINEGYLLLQSTGRPLITLKIATTMDGRIATQLGESHWITGDEARAHAHLMRSTQDAVMVGVGTIIADDPRLNCRLEGLENNSPIRVIVDSRLRTSLISNVVETAKNQPTWIITLETSDPKRRKALEDLGVDVIEVAADNDGYPDLGSVVNHLAARGITRLMVEGGSHLAGSMVRNNLIDRVLWYRSSSIMGSDGIPSVGAYGTNELASMARFKRGLTRPLGKDLLETYIRED